VGEWLFALPDAEKDERYLALLPDGGLLPEYVALLRRLRPRVDDLVSHWARRLVAAGHDIVGFSSSYARTRANVRLAEAIRRLAPGTRIIVGGAGASGDMGLALLEAFPVFDLICHTEADDLIVPIVRALRGEPGTSLETVSGISYRQGDRIATQMSGAALPDIERTALPDYEDYFATVRTLRDTWDDRLVLPLWLPLEAARGCWWGAREHCTFCSFNADRMLFRAKSPGRVLSDISALAARHGMKEFLLVDNILGNDYYRTLLPRLSELRGGYKFWWEIRPNLGRAKAELLSRAGVGWVQAGIESLSTPALHLMHKGTSAIDNIHALKWLSAYQVECYWVFLYSLPGERLEWYEDVVRRVPRLMHLQPPDGPRRIAAQRFSPLVTHADEHGVRLLGPSVHARLAFADVSPAHLERFCCQFDYEIDGRFPGFDASIHATLGPSLARWRENYSMRGCTLSVIDGPGESLLVEGPLLRPDRILRLRGTLLQFLKGCESIQPERILLKRLAAGEPMATNGEPPLTSIAFRRLLEALCFTGVQPEDGPTATASSALEIADERGWIFRESGRVLSLPVNMTHFVKSGLFQVQAALRYYQ
jgi:magnesium-protoporphyrin IX monomethyl ester (oxidative) cyclase